MSSNASNRESHEPSSAGNANAPANPTRCSDSSAVTPGSSPGDYPSLHVHTDAYDDPLLGFTLNHPKNYFGVPLAVAADEPTDDVIRNALVKATDRAKAGAVALNLITSDEELTSVGETIVTTVTSETTIADELETFASLKGSTERFLEATPRYWHPLTKFVLQQHSVTGDVVTLLERTGPVTLVELAATVARTDHCAQSILFREPNSISYGDEVDSSKFEQPSMYAGRGVYQFKNFLYHCGILTERGADTSALIPEQDVWALEPALLSLGGEF